MEKNSCKRCQSEKSTKAGKMNCKQRYRCKDCGYHFTSEDGRVKYGANDRFVALTLDLFGNKNVQIQ